MKIRLIHQYFHPDISSVSQVISEVAFYLASQGDEVSVICSRNRYEYTDSGPRPSRETVEGVKIRRCWGPSFGRTSRRGYFFDMASFCVLGILRSVWAPKVDTVVVLTNPPLFSLLGVLMKRLRKERFVYVLMDVYPDVAVQAGIIRKGSITERVIRRLSQVSLREADCIVVLGDDMREVAIREGALPENVVMIRNWSDPEAIFPVPPEKNPLRHQWGLEGKFVIQYSGNLGVSHFFEDILAVAAELESQEDVRFVFVGGGTRFNEVERSVNEKNLSNVLLMPYCEKSALAHSLSVGDVHYVCLRPGFEGFVVPSKAYGIMAAGRPLIYQGNSSGEIARMVTREKIGQVVLPGDRKGLREAILALYRDRSARDRMGKAARAALQERYSRAVGLNMYRKVLGGMS